MHTIFIPYIAKNAAPSGAGDSATYTVFELLQCHPDQERHEMIWNDTLSRVAEARAHDMATRNYFSHTNPDGIGPNFLLRQAGYALPDWYEDDRDGNNVESIGGGYATAADVVAGLIDSPAHRQHLLGEIDFFRDQTNVGIGFAFNPNSKYKNYWSIISAPPEG